MKRLNLTFKTLTVMIVCALFTMMVTSCQDEPIYDGNGNVIEGLPATVKLQIDLSEMSVQTRAIVDDEGSNFCENVWVGMFLESSGECVYDSLYTDPSSYIEKTAPTKYALALPEVMTVSGNCYIVAVANVNAVEAIPSAGSSEDPVPLGNFLNKNLTWEGFKNLCAVRSSTDDIYQLTYTLPMAGFYADVNSTENSDCEAKDITQIEAVAIKAGANVLPQAIHLRRLISYNKFNIIPNSAMTVDLVSWQVYNNPYVTYVVEGADNAGDHASGTYNPSLVSSNFTSNFGKDENGKTTTAVESYSFEFYQFENKRTACVYNSTSDVGIDPNLSDISDLYNQREREYKTDKKLNTSIYRSLVSDKANEDSLKNNNASYVVLKAKMSYYYDKKECSDPKTASPKAKDKCAEPILRTAEATYVIHLGFCGTLDGKSSNFEKARDFNCRRNSSYTYNVKIYNVNNIVVEAYEESDKTDQENQPGMEGIVRDTDLEYIELDSHYNVFNIALTNKDRSGLYYYITAPFNGKTYTISYQDKEENMSAFTKSLYSWIKFRSAKNKNTLAKYKASDLDDSKLWTLEQLRDVVNHPHSSEESKAAALKPNSENEDDIEAVKKFKEETDTLYYTVFIDEYVYHVDENGTFESGSDATGYDETMWRYYVNQDDRIVELASVNEKSFDEESHYLDGKYAFAQKSIQTYYDENLMLAAGVDPEGLGVEHTNESYGLNYQWDTKQTSIYYRNGRANLYLATHTSTVNGSWANCVDMTVPEDIPADTNFQTKMNNIIPHITPPVPQLHLYSTSPCMNAPSPHTKRVYNINTACMNRNRDLNGDGVIDDNELRWFLPTYSQYVEIQVGRSGLVDPLIEYTDWPKDRYSSLANYKWKDNSTAGTNTTKGRQNFHFASSDCNYIWADEGFSKASTTLSNPIYNMDDYAYHPYEIRCARYLGKNPNNALKDKVDKNETQTAYQINSTNNHEIDVVYFTSTCFRPYVSTFLAPNSIESDLNRPYKKFEVAQDFCKGYSDEFISTSDAGGMSTLGTASYESNYDYTTNQWYKSLQKNGICSQYSQTGDGVKTGVGAWRAPNIVEMAMMELEGLLITNKSWISSTHEYFIQFPDNDYCPYAFFGYKDNGISRSLLQNGKLSRTYLVCVRDVK